MTTAPVQTEQHDVIRRPASYEEYQVEASESHIAEWVDGEMIEYMPPLLHHQEITWFLFSLIKGFVEALDLGLVGAGPFEFKLWPGGPAREPDVFFISKTRLAHLTERRFEGSPDIAVEVISHGSVREDRVRKFSEYEQAGVGEYWLIDSRPYQQTAEFYRRDSEGLLQPVEIQAGIFLSTALPHFRFHVEWLWRTPMPSYRDVLQAIFDGDDTLPPGLRAV
jgi:Uma2 family endonuclease